MKARILFLFVTALLLAAIPVAAQQPSADNQQAQVSHADTTCPFGVPPDEVVGKTIVCGELTVPENWQQPGAAKVTISYAILKSPGLSPFPDPVVYLEGGPGASALAGLPMLQSTFAELRRYRDVIIYDQRGTAFSSPLICPTETQQQPVAGPKSIADAARGVESNIDDLVNNAKTLDGYRTAVNCAPYFKKQGIDLSQYNTANSVQDLIALMDSFDYKAYNLYAISYGTNVALELLRHYEENAGATLPALRSAILDGNVPPNVDTRGGQALITPSNILRVFETCEADKACAAAFPSIRQRALALIQKTAKAPLEIGKETISVADLRKVMGAALSLKADEKGNVSAIGATYLPRMIDELEHGVANTFVGLRDGKLPPAAAAPTPAPANPLQTIAGETSTLAGKAHALGDEIEALSLQSKRAADALTSRLPLSDFFISELRIGVSQMDYMTKLFFPGGLEFALQGEPSRETLLDVAGGVGPELAALVPLMSDEDIERTFAMLREVLPTLTPVDSITNTVITCNDRYASFDLDKIFATYRAFEAPELIQKIDVAVNDKVDCEAWGLTPEDTELAAPVVSDLPIMVSNGAIDAETPVEWGEAAAEGLKQAFFVTFPYYPHGASTQFNCGPAVATAFVMYPEQQPNLACADELLRDFPFIQSNKE